jgi:hypothetical protein
MADVVMLKPALVVAPMIRGIVQGSFTGTQVRILLTLAVLGVSERGSAKMRPVRISREVLAREAGMRASGGFVKALTSLVARGFVTVVEPGKGRRPATYSLEKGAQFWMHRWGVLDDLDEYAYVPVGRRLPSVQVVV